MNFFNDDMLVLSSVLSPNLFLSTLILKDSLAGYSYFLPAPHHLSYLLDKECDVSLSLICQIAFKIFFWSLVHSSFILMCLAVSFLFIQLEI